MENNKINKAKDTVAKKYGFENWTELLQSQFGKVEDSTFIDTPMIEKYENEAISLYHQTEKEEAGKELPTDEVIKEAIREAINNNAKFDSFDVGMIISKWMRSEASNVITKIKAESDRFESLYKDYSNELDHTKQELKSTITKKDEEIEKLKDKAEKYASIVYDLQHPKSQLSKLKAEGEETGKIKLKEIQKKISALAKRISNEATIDDDVTGGYMAEPENSLVTELYQICDLLEKIIPAFPEGQTVLVKRSIEKGFLPKVFAVYMTNEGELKYNPEKKWWIRYDNIIVENKVKWWYEETTLIQPLKEGETLPYKPILGEGFVKSVLEQYKEEKISFGKMVELMNEKIQFVQTKEGDGKIELLSKEKNIVCWIVPVSYENPNRTTWGYEIELLPYSDIGKYYQEKEGTDFIYSYQQWDNYDEAKQKMIERANELYKLFIKTK